ncbi:MAG: hypothetical protein MUW55_14210 [Pantoea vagans]|nr:hypothetical protein [Pantoea vagans]
MSSLDAFFRDVTHHEFALDTQLRTQKLDEVDKEMCTCPIPTLLELAPLIIAQKEFAYSYLKNTLVLNLQDVDFYPQNSDEPTHLCLLFNATDSNGSTTVLRNPKKKTRRAIEPDHKNGEGYEFSSHILISLTGDKRTYKAVISRAPKISTNIIELFFNKILFQISRTHPDKFTSNVKTNATDSTTGKTKKILFKPVAQLRGTLDKELFDKMNSGGLSEVTLIRYDTGTIKVPDMNGVVIPIESTLKIKPVQQSPDVIGWLRNIGGYFNKKTNGNYKDIRVKYHDDNSKSRTVKMHTTNIQLAALEKSFIKRSIIEGFNSRLSNSYDNIDIAIVNKLNELL